MKTLKTILIEYAQTRGGGLPLTAEEICNAVVLWAQQYLSSASAGRNVTVEEVDGKLVISVQDSALANYLVNNFEASQGSLEVDRAGNNGYDISINEEWLKTFIENFLVGSETVVVDYDEENQKLEIHLDDTVIQKLERAILMPLNNVGQKVVTLTGNKYYFTDQAGFANNISDDLPFKRVHIPLYFTHQNVDYTVFVVLYTLTPYQFQDEVNALNKLKEIGSFWCWCASDEGGCGMVYVNINSNTNLTISGNTFSNIDGSHETSFDYDGVTFEFYHDEIIIDNM